MGFFNIKQDSNVKNPIIIEGFKSNRRIEFSKEEADEINDLTMLYFQGNEDSVFFDFYVFPLYLVSSKIKEIVEHYDDKVIFKPCVLTNIENEMQKVYYLMILDKVDCISEKSEFYNSSSIKNLIIDKQTTQKRNIFQISTMNNNYLIVTLGLLESILRRDPQGVAWEAIPLSK